MSCGSPSSVIAKSFAVSPSIGSPFLVLHGHCLDDEARFSAEDRLLRRRRSGWRRTRRSDDRDRQIRCRAHQNLTRRLDSSLRIALAAVRQAELRAADDGVQARVSDAIQHVGGVDPPVHRPSAPEHERPRDAGVQRELRWAGNRIACRRCPTRPARVRQMPRGSRRTRPAHRRRASRYSCARIVPVRPVPASDVR